MTSLVHTARARSLPVALLAAALCLVTVSSAAAQPWPNTHQGWFLGFGVGGGSAQLKLNDDVFTSGPRSERDAGGAGSFRFGYDFTPQLGLGLESSAWVKSETDEGVDYMTTIGVSAATLYYHPENTGVVLKGGVGLGTYRLSASEGSMSLSLNESAFGLLAGLAYEFRVRRTFSVGPEVTFGWAPFDEFSTTHLNAGLAFDWHFIPR